MSGNSYLAEIEDGRRIVWMAPEDARAMIGSPFADQDLRRANADLLNRLGNLPPLRAGVRVADLLQAARDATPRDPRDIGGMARDTLRMTRALRE